MHKRIVFTLLMVLFGCLQLLQGQQRTCLDFENLEAGTKIGRSSGLNPGEVWIEEEGIKVRLEKFLYLDRQTDFWDVWIQNTAFGPRNFLKGNYIFPSNINLLIDFSDLPGGAAQEVCFDFVDGGGEENITVNGQEIKVVRAFNEFATFNFPEVAVTFQPVSNTDPSQPAGTLCFKGKIKTLLVGGQELGIDQFCFQAAGEPDCKLGELKADPQPCTPNGIFYVDLSFKASNVGSSGFSVRGNGREYGRFQYGAEKYAVGPLQGDGITDYEFEIIDNQNPDCRVAVDLGPVICNVKCGIEDLEAAVLPCDETGMYGFHLNFKTNSNQAFTLYFDKDSIGTFHTADLPLTLKGLVLPKSVFTTGVQLHDTRRCEAKTFVRRPDCVSKWCIDFEDVPKNVYGKSTGVEEGQEIYTEKKVGIKLLPYQSLDWDKSFGDLFVQPEDSFPDFPLSDGKHLLLKNISTAFNFTAVEAPIEKVTVYFYFNEQGVNIAANGGQLLILQKFADGEAQLTPDVKVKMQVDRGNEVFGLLIFTGNIKSLLIGGKCLRLDNLCYEVKDDCELGEMQVEHTPCNDEGQYFVTFDFDFARVSDSFYLWQNGNEIGKYAYADLPIKLGPFTRPLTQTLTYQAFDTKNNSCRTVGLLKPFTCPVEECALKRAKVTNIECDGDFYQLTLNLDYQGVTDSFVFKTQSGYYSTIAYEDLPVSIAGIPSPSQGYDLFWVCDQNNPNCCFEGKYEVPCKKVCEIGEVKAVVSDCNSAGAFFVEINFEHEFTSDSFVLIADGRQWGKYKYYELPIKLGPFKSEGRQALAFKVLDESESCFQEFEIKTPNCPTTEECLFRNVKVAPQPCIDGKFFVDVAFEVENPGSRGYMVIVGDQVRGPFNYDQKQHTFGPFAAGAGSGFAIILMDLEFPGTCSSSISVDPVNCEDNCRYYDAEALSRPCREDGTFLAVMKFGFENVGNQGYSLYVNNDKLGDFKYDEPFPTIGPLKGDGVTKYVFTVVDNEKGCKINATLGPVKCGTQEICEIFDLEANAGSCNGDGTYPVKVNFEYKAATNEQFDVFYKDQIIGTYKLSDLPVTLEHFKGSGEPKEVLVVCINDNANCCAKVQFEVPKCDIQGECKIIELEANAGACNDDGTYPVKIHFEYKAATNESFDVFYKDQIIGTYKLSQLPVTLEHFKGSGEPKEVLVVCINDNANCCAKVQFEVPKCDIQGECEIIELEANAGACKEDGTYPVKINFEYKAATNEQFDVLYKDQIIGTYKLSDLPVTLEHFKGSGEPKEVLVVCINDNANCCAKVQFEVPKCQAEVCSIFDLKAVPGPCNEDGSFPVTVNFMHKNAGNPLFDVYRGDQIIGTYKLKDLPITIEQFKPSDSEVQKILVCINDSENCCAKVEFKRPDCEQDLKCGFYDLRADPRKCNQFGNFYVDLRYKVRHPVSDSFSIIGAAHSFGRYSYAKDTVITLGPFNGDGLSNLKFVFTDSGDPFCQGYIELAPVKCEPEHVWPGDTDRDNVAKHTDLLNIGLAYGVSGPPRPEQVLDWRKLLALAWNPQFVNGVNYKHSDCNGDGVVNAQDIEAIRVNYGRINGQINTRNPLPGTLIDPPIFFELPQSGNLPNGTSFKIPIILGTNARPMIDLYGLAFSIEFDPKVIDPKSINITYPPSWFGDTSQNLITIHKVHGKEGVIEIAMSKIDQRHSSGAGPIAYLGGVIDNLIGLTAASVQVKNVFAMQLDELQIPIYSDVQHFIIGQQQDDPGKIDLQKSLRIFPNPTSDEVRIMNTYGHPMDFIQIYDAKGVLISQPSPDSDRFSLKKLPQGTYFFKIKIGEYILHEKVVKY